MDSISELPDQLTPEERNFRMYLSDLLILYAKQYENMSPEDRAHPYGRYILRIVGMANQAMQQQNFSRSTAKIIGKAINNQSLTTLVFLWIDDQRQQAALLLKDFPKYSGGGVSRLSRHERTAYELIDLKVELKKTTVRRPIQLESTTLLLNDRAQTLKNLYDWQMKLQDNQRLFDSYWAEKSSLLKKHVGGRRRTTRRRRGSRRR